MAKSFEDPALCLQLIRSRRIGPTTFHRLVAERGGVEAALAALPEIAKASGVADYEVCPYGVVKHELAQGRAARARLLVFGGPDYPQRLMDLADAPPVLWAQGDVALLSRPMVALVGARNASSLGLRMARKLAASLGAAGQVVVSGLARGIDAEAHQATLETGTVAVQAGGVDVIYPIENSDLAAEILRKGCRVSEQPMGMEPQTRHFPQRNRIVSGLSRGVVVVEAAAKSGSLITADCALEQGREVFAVPGHPFDARAAGCNRLIRDGATLVRGPQDVFDVLAISGRAPVLPDSVIEEVQPAPLPDPLPGPVPPRRPLADMASVHSLILARLGPSPMAEDQLIRDLAMPAAALTPELLTLELDGKIERQSGGLISRR
ncbi:DNA-protecting protein DprA [bacterium]|nr:DNA-protecting protein DprA [bacterium]